MSSKMTNDISNKASAMSSKVSDKLPDSLSNSTPVNDDEEYQRRRKQSLDAKHEGIRIAKAGKRVFQPDDVIGRSKTWRLIQLLTFYHNNWLHRLEFAGYTDELMALKDRGILTVHMHTTHNCDIAFAIIATYRVFGKVCRGLVHRSVMTFCPWLQNLGMLPGYRDTTEKLLSDGFWVSVIPGGGEEAMRGHENAYNLDWPKNRRGFAKVAIKTESPIVPIFYHNMDEMRYNPVFHLWNLIGGSKVYTMVVKAKIPFISAMVKLIAEFIWFGLSWIFSFYVPSKVIAYVGKPIYTSKTDDIDATVKKVYTEFQALIHEKQPGGKNYRRAFNEWLEDRRKYPNGDWPVIRSKQK